MIRNKRGFTLLEVLIVLVILGVLAGLAVPVYTAQLERARAAEAIQMLGAIRSSMVRYYGNNGTYAGAVIRGYQGGTTTGDIDFDANNQAIGGQRQHFSYQMMSQSANAFTVRTGPAPGGPVGPPTGPSDDWIEISEDGTITRSGIYQ